MIKISLVIHNHVLVKLLSQQIIRRYSLSCLSCTLALFGTPLGYVLSSDVVFSLNIVPYALLQCTYVPMYFSFLGISQLILDVQYLDPTHIPLSVKYLKAFVK